MRSASHRLKSNFSTLIYSTRPLPPSAVNRFAAVPAHRIISRSPSPSPARLTSSLVPSTQQRLTNSIHHKASIMTTTTKPVARDLPVEEVRTLMSQHFTQYSGPKYADGWAKLWDEGQLLPWDRFAPSPALADTLVKHSASVGNAMLSSGSRRKRALVPGCGRGVDVLLLESFGYDVIGLEYSPKAVEACEEFAEEHGKDYPVMDGKVGKGSKKYVRGDFYASSWLEEVGLPTDTTFELIYDYTFFCAMQPAMRPAWAKRMSELLGPSAESNLICLEFPTSKPVNAGGPPFASPSKAYLEHLSHPGKEVKYDEEGNVKWNPLAEASQGGLERVGHWHPADTHAIGKDNQGNVKDFIAIWRHR